MIPDFDAEGLLPPGDYEVSFEELRRSTLVMGGEQHRENWDAAWRAQLVRNFEKLSRQLWSVGIRDIYADGSFVEDKDHPNDIDGYFVCDLHSLITGELARQLNLLDPSKVWTWDPATRRPYRGYPKKQLPMWASVPRRTIRMCLGLASDAESSTSMVTNSNSHPLFVSAGVMASPKAS
jgi:hypothetical protein